MSSDLVRVRPGLARDASKLRSIRLEALADTPDAYGETYAECAAWDDEVWTRKAEEWNFYLAEINGRVVGMARGESHNTRSDIRFLFAMYVAPSARGTDVARRLVDAVSAWARVQGVNSLYLYVSNAVPRARAFYAKVGFVATGSSLSMHRDESLVCDEMCRDLEEFSFRVRAVEASQLYDLRRRVLRDGDPTVDVVNPGDGLVTTRHFGGFLGERPVVSASFYEVEAPFAPGERAYQLRYMATDFDVQGRGLGAQLLERALEELPRGDVGRVWANARTSAQAFYEANGWSVLPNSLFVSQETGIDHVVIQIPLV
jgi:GNAT superfamily N-acetyltransferase